MAPSVALDDDSESVVLPPAVVEECFHRGLWDAINGAFGLLIDEYEGEEVPVQVMSRCADLVRAYVTAQPDLSLSTSQILGEVAELLDHGVARGVSAWISL